MSDEINVPVRPPTHEKVVFGGGKHFMRQGGDEPQRRIKGAFRRAPPAWEASCFWTELKGSAEPCGVVPGELRGLNEGNRPTSVSRRAPD